MFRDIIEPHKSFADRVRDFAKDCTKSFIWNYEKTYDKLGSSHQPRDIDSPAFKKAFERFAEELEVVLANGFVYEYCLAGWILDYAFERKRLAFTTHNTAYSFLAYLYGISDVDPIEKGYPLEMLLDLRLNRKPAFWIVTSDDFAKETMEFLKDRFGEENVETDGSNSVTVTYPLSAVGSDKYKIDTAIFGNPFIDSAEKKLCLHDNEGCNYRFALDKRYFPGVFPECSDLSPTVRELLVDIISCPHYTEDNIRNNLNQFLDTVYDGTIEGIIRTISITKGSGIWKSMCEHPVQDAVGLYTRDNVYKFGLSLTGDKERAFHMMEQVRKGRGIPENERKKYRDNPAVRAVFDYCDGIQYMVSEGACVPYARLICSLANKIDNDRSDPAHTN